MIGRRGFELKKRESKSDKKKSGISKLGKVAAGLGTYFFGGIKSIPVNPPSGPNDGADDILNSVTLS